MKGFQKIFLNFLLVLPLIVNAQILPEKDIHWEHWNVAYLQAKSENKILIIELYTDWCTWCKKMEKETFSNPEIVELINKNFIAVRINPEDTKTLYDYNGKKLTARQLMILLSAELKHDFKYPAIILIYPTANNLVFREEGFQKAGAFKQLLKSHLMNLEKATVKIQKD